MGCSFLNPNFDPPLSEAVLIFLQQFLWYKRVNPGIPDRVFRRLKALTPGFSFKGRGVTEGQDG
jgi:hypothetical protein